MASFWWVLGVLCAVLALDRLASVAARRGWIYWRQGKQSKGAGPALGALMDALQPSRQIVSEESRFQRMRVDETHAEAGVPLVDLDRNRVWLRGAGLPPASPVGDHRSRNPAAGPRGGEQ